jgi:hypothetical protein
MGDLMVARPLVTLLVAAGALLPAACTAGGTAPPPQASCSAPVNQGELPVWARSGFHPATTRIAHVLGVRGNIVAILFGYPLLSPPDPSRRNKILWVSRLQQRPLSPLRITGRLQGGRASIRREVAGGPGPSIINFPARGCWQLSLRWGTAAGTATDSMALHVR